MLFGCGYPGFGFFGRFWFSPQLELKPSREGSSHDERRVRVREQLSARESLRGRGQQRNDAGHLPHFPLRGEHRDFEPPHRHDRQQDRGALQEGRRHTTREDRRPGPEM